jgi:hypothetical protein
LIGKVVRGWERSGTNVLTVDVSADCLSGDRQANRQHKKGKILKEGDGRRPTSDRSIDLEHVRFIAEDLVRSRGTKHKKEAVV